MIHGLICLSGALGDGILWNLYRVEFHRRQDSIRHGFFSEHGREHRLIKVWVSPITLLMMLHAGHSIPNRRPNIFEVQDDGARWDHCFTQFGRPMLDVTFHVSFPTSAIALETSLAAWLAINFSASSEATGLAKK